ncbi:transporter substrate-binding domain-containing protein [Shewanella eurypsychrophilus]|uniref:Transporter substrate-binding domain-containing protein n=1 Tax=Shewanella eurypsychrophilus TaxID=2593656 RepID=A0ABX6VCJ6_9GAMM|nr:MULTISPECIES: transporter substrate-binding domain-containing protein [Shewanella]QPG59273.2 transporter substrate-binding domain-containing protein [Shewanella eurypsychrophilus]
MRFVFILKTLIVTGVFILSSYDIRADQTVTSLSSTELRLITEPWAPVSYEERGVAKGFAVELVHQLQHFVGSNENIEVMPWARAISIAEKTPKVLLFATSINEARRAKFHFVGPILSSNVSLFALTEDEIQINSVEDLKSIGTIGVYRGTIGEALLKQAGVLNLQLASFPEHSVKQLFKGRIRLWCQADVAVASLLEKVGKQSLGVKSVFSFDKIVLYLAFSKGSNKQVIEHWAKALTVFKRSGKFKRLHAKYFGDISVSVSDSVEILWLEN